MLSASPRSGTAEPGAAAAPAAGAAARSASAGRVLLVGGSSEIGLAIVGALRLGPQAEVLLAGRDCARLEAAAATLPCQVRLIDYDASEPDSHQGLATEAFADGPVDLVISAVGVLTPQPDLDAAPQLAAELIQASFTSHVTCLLALAARMRPAGRGTIVVLSSVAAIRPRRANFVYGAAKAGLDAFARGFADSLHSSGVRVVLVRPGFVTGRMTAGLPPAPLASTPTQVGAAVAAGLDSSASVIWVPAALRPVAAVLRLIPRPLWRRLRR